MFIVNCIGGLGNQLFQHALIEALIARGSEVKLAVDQFGVYRQHDGFLLNDLFPHRIPVADSRDLCEMLGPVFRRPWTRRILARHSLARLRPRKFLVESDLGSSLDIFSLNGDYYLQGYWQALTIFRDIAGNLRRLHGEAGKIIKAPQFERIKDEMSNSISVSVHFRGGDYLSKKNSKVYANCKVEYYERAMKFFRERYDGVKFYIFSDDPAEMSKVIPWNCDCNFVRLEREGLSLSEARLMSYFEMCLMSKCGHNIIANSTFSWWGAFLGVQDNRSVLAPLKWFNGSRENLDLIPDHWTRI